MLPLLENELRRLEGRRRRGRARRAAGGAAAEPRARSIIVDKPGAPQSQIRIGWIGVPRSTPDYFPIQVLNTILGGSFTSRLNMNLREKHGYTYGASSAFDMRRRPGPFFAAAGVQTDKTAEALKEFFNELNAILQPVPADELARAKNYVALRFPAGFETTRTSRGASKTRSSTTCRTTTSRSTSRTSRRSPPPTCSASRTKYIQPDKIAVVVVGDRKVDRAGHPRAEPGPDQGADIDDVFGPPPAPSK